jgi:hypothetical protein
MLAHSIGVYPPPNQREPKLTELFFVLETAIMSQFQLFKDMADHSTLTCAEAATIPRLIACQNERQASILEKKREEQEARDRRQAGGRSPSSDGSSPLSSSPHPHWYTRKGVYVVAFDIETVENIRSIQTPDKVYEPFVLPPPPHLPPGISADHYTIPQAQIPYTVQWGFIDMDYAATPPYVPGGVLIEYGRDATGKELLGRCVTDFFDNVRDSLLARTRGEGKVKCYAYAHNASGFDAYILKFYNHKYPVNKILHTPRGILCEIPRSFFRLL